MWLCVSDFVLASSWSAHQRAAGTSSIPLSSTVVKNSCNNRPTACAVLQVSCMMALMRPFNFNSFPKTSMATFSNLSTNFSTSFAVVAAVPSYDSQIPKFKVCVRSFTEDPLYSGLIFVDREGLEGTEGGVGVFGAHTSKVLPWLAQLVAPSKCATSCSKLSSWRHLKQHHISAFLSPNLNKFVSSHASVQKVPNSIYL